MKRFAIILLAVATALVMALPATAKKPVNPEPEPEPEPATTYAAEIEMLGSKGVETTCVGPIEVTRTDTRGGAITHFESGGAELMLTARVDGLLDKCHGDAVFPEYFRITLDGDQVAMLWIFDVTFDENGDYRKDFRMGGPYEDTESKNGKITTDFADWGNEVDVDGVITTGGIGTFVFVRYEAGGDPMFTVLENGSQEFSLEITLTPAS